MEGKSRQEHTTARWRVSPQVIEKGAHSPAERSLERWERTATAGTAMSAVRTGGAVLAMRKNDMEGCRDLWEEEWAKKKKGGVKLVIEG